MAWKTGFGRNTVASVRAAGRNALAIGCGFLIWAAAEPAPAQQAAPNSTAQQAAPNSTAQQTPAAPAAPNVASEDIGALLGEYKVSEENGRKVVEISLAQALQLALRRSISLQATRLGETLSDSQITASRERNFPTLEHQFDYGRSVTVFPSFGAGNRTDAYSYQATLSKKLDSGMQVSAIFRDSHQEVTGFAVDADGSPGAFGSSAPFEASSLTGQVIIPFFQDSGEVNDTPIRLAEVGLRSSRNNTRQGQFDLLRLVATTYWDLVGIREQIRVQGEALKLSQQLLTDNRVRLQAGVLSPADVKVSETQLAQDRQSLLTSRVDERRIEDQVRGALNLGALEHGLKPVETPALRQARQELDALLLKTYSTDPALANFEADLVRNRYLTEQSENKAKTNLDLALRYTMNGFGKDTSTAASNMSEFDLHGYGATLTWTVPLFDATTREELAQRRVERAQIELRIASQRSDLTVQAQAVQRLLQLAEEEVNTARVTVSLQNELLQNEIERFKLGESTSFRVSQAQQDYSQAQQGEILARVRYEKIFLEMLLLSGDIFTQYGLTNDRP